MAGVSSVVGEFSRIQLREKARQFDAKYVKSWIIRDDAMDLMTLKYEEISVDEHYARLYGPRILVAENKINEILAPDDDSEEGGEGVIFRQQSSKTSQLKPPTETSDYIERKTLEAAFKSSPYERFKNKSYREDSEEHIMDQIQKQRQMRTKAIWTTALAKAKIGASIDRGDEEVLVPGAGSNNPAISNTRPKSLFTLGDAADKLLQNKGGMPLQVRRGQSVYGDGQRLRQVYRDAFLSQKKQRNPSDIEVVITESETRGEDSRSNASRKDSRKENEKDR